MRNGEHSRAEEELPLTEVRADSEVGHSTVKVFVSEHCNNGVVDGSFGELKFQNGQTSPYIVVTKKNNADIKDISPEILWELMTTCWNMTPPKLVISVFGGDSKFVLKERLKRVNKGLASAAKSTGAWIFTSGLYRGVSKYVGEAIWSGANCLAESEQPAVNVIGVATWGNVPNRDRLQGERGIGKFPVKYSQEHGPQSKTAAPLDLNHTHFILVDDGTVETPGWSDVEVRTGLEQYIGQRKAGRDSKDRTIPVVLMLIEGGSTMLRTMKKALEREIPVVILDGSGGASDVIAYACRKKRKNKWLKLEDVEDKLRSALDLKWDRRKVPDDVKSHMRNLNSIVQEKNEKLVTVVSLLEAGATDIDKALLRALLKAETASPEDQLQLALDWNTPGIAWQDEIFTRNRMKKLQKIDKDPYLENALLQDNAEAVDMLLDNGAQLSTFLTEPKLVELCEALCDKREDDTLKRLVEKKKYSDDRGVVDVVNAVVCNTLLQSQMENILGFKKDTCAASRTQDEDGVPERNLFFWAALTKRNAIARLMWRRGTDQIAAALTASKMLKRLSSIAKSEGQPDEYKQHSDLAEQLEKDAIGVMDECYELDQGRTRSLLSQPQTDWGNVSCMAMANSGRHMEFMSHDACQTNLNRVWYGKMEWFTPLWKVILSLIFFPVTIFTITFTEDGGGSADADSFSFTSYLRAIYSYQTAPITKFCYTLVSYVAFLVIFSLFLLTDFRPEKISPLEGFIVVYMSVQLLDEIMQIVSKDPISCRHKLHAWWSDVWNRLDAALLATFFLAFILHCALRESNMTAVQVGYSCALILAFYRPLQMFYVHEKIGPKIVMILKMLQDLLIFMSFVVVFILAYGVVRIALISPNSLLSWTLLVDIVRVPYWQMYGETFTDDDGNVSGPWFVPILQAAYLLITNVLLINLLIAMFSYTFQNIQDTSEQYWKYNRYSLIHEYVNRPWGVPPLTLLPMMWKLVRFACCSLNHGSPEQLTSGGSGGRQQSDTRIVVPGQGTGCCQHATAVALTDKREIQRQQIFQRLGAENYVMKEKQGSSDEKSDEIAELKRRMDELSEQIAALSRRTEDDEEDEVDYDSPVEEEELDIEAYRNLRGIRP